MIERVKIAFLTVICALGVACGGGGGGGGFLQDDTAAPLVIATTELPPLAQVPYAEVLEASGGREPYSWAMVNDDGTGLTVDPNGVLRAETGTKPGEYAITIAVTDDSGARVERALTIDITLPQLAISTTALPAAPEGVSYSAILEAEGGEPPFIWELVNDAGTGLTISSDEGLLTGFPATTPGTYGLTFKLTDANGLTDQRSLLLEVTGDVPGPLTITTPDNLPPATEDESYAAILAAEGGTGDYSWRLLSDGNSGFRLSSAGVLTGAGPIAGSYGLTFEVNDGFNIASSSSVLTVSGDDTPVTIDTSSLPPALLGVPYAAVLSASGTAPFSWSLVDAGGTGFSLSSAGVLSGTPSENGAFPITVRVTDGKGERATGALIVQVGASGGASDLAIATAALPSGTQGDPYAVVMRAFGGTGTKTWSVREDPDASGLNFVGVADQEAGLLTSAALPGAGSYTLVIEVRDTSAGVDLKEFTLVVNAP